MAALGIIPKAAAKKIWDKGGKATFDIKRIDAIEREVKHDVIAFLTHLAEIVGPEARFVHQGMTSSDVLDTCLNVQLVRAADLLVADVDMLLAALKRRAFEHKLTPTIGRSHGIHAEPTTFGLKLALAYAEFARARERLLAARKEVATCAISGAVGTFAQVDPRVEAHVAKAMGLAAEPISTQIVPRDRHAMYFATLGVVAASVERLATEIRHLQRTEVLEAEEFFSEGQTGAGERRALARARHLAFLGRAHDRPRRHRNARLRACPARRHRGQARRLSGQHAQEPRPARRADPFPARADRAHPERRGARGGLCAGAAQRHEGLARRG
jgi:adenylosuccinate lyase